jgi:hypothetical protein
VMRTAWTPRGSADGGIVGAAYDALAVAREYMFCAILIWVLLVFLRVLVGFYLAQSLGVSTSRVPD